MNTTDSTVFVSLNTAALLTGKSAQTIRNWLASGAAKQRNNSPLNGEIDENKNIEIDILSIDEHIPTELTPAFLESVEKSKLGISKETTNIAIEFSKSHADRTDKIAIPWFELAAKQGDNDAMFWLWDIYYKGYGVDPDFAVAIQWLGKAAKHGSLFAQATVEGLRKTDAYLKEQKKDDYKVIVEDVKRLASIKDIKRGS